MRGLRKWETEEGGVDQGGTQEEVFRGGERFGRRLKLWEVHGRFAEVYMRGRAPCGLDHESGEDQDVEVEALQVFSAKAVRLGRGDGTEQRDGEDNEGGI